MLRALASDYRIYRVEDQLGQKNFQSHTFVARLRQTYSDVDASQIVGGNMFRVFSQVLPA
ncbi:MAG: hypothetical protein JO004_05610 [Methylobacteriaceae bacterium]|nr:hypothetical protein [Methylobacteriaceae bacterium]